ncbi:MAG TPA: hypothetical protein VGS19_20325 [Streptosporangiaceae bacterium]|nr:hypothetical protein [Streptosporangiaceae bacterium]
MFLTPLPVDVFLAQLLSASEACEYMGVVLLLARTADSRSQHEELTRDWTSVHDVTGPLLAVVCPVPYQGPGPTTGIGGGVYHRKHEMVAGVEGLSLNFSRASDTSSLETHFWRPLDPLGWKAARRPLPPEEHQESWTQATTRAALYFGIDESLLPGILILSLQEHRGALIQVADRLSIYELFKKLVENIGPEPRRLEEMLQEQRTTRRRLERLAEDASVWRSLTRRVPIEWPAQVDALDRRLMEIEHLDPALVAECRRRLNNVRDDGSSDQILAGQLSQIIDLLPSGPGTARIGVPRDLARRIRRVIFKLEHGHPGIGFLQRQPVPPDLDQIPGLRSRRDQLRDEIESKRQLVKRTVSLSEAAVKTGEELLNPMETIQLQPPRLLPTWTFTQLRRRQEHPQRMRQVRT